MIKKDERPEPDDQAAAEDLAAGEGPAAKLGVQAELEDLMDRLKRTTADYQNYQKRVAREMAETRKYATSDLARAVLTVVDDLERAMSAGEGVAEGPAAGILDGVRITHEHLMAVLAQHGVQPIRAQGQPFDPQLHEAMMRQPSDEVPPMTVLAELSKGYTMHERTLRPARVIVSAAPEK